MIKLNFEYIIINDKIAKINTSIKRDDSTTVLEKAVCEYALQLVKQNTPDKELFEDPITENILSNIGK